MNKLFYCYLICLSFFSCTDTFDEDKYSLGEKQLYLLVSEDNMVFNYEGGNSMIEIEGNSLWYAKVEGKFVTLSKNKGGNNSKRFNEIIDVKVHPNPFAANRKAHIQIYNDANDSLVATINIEQSLNEEEMNKYEVVDLGLSVKWATKNFDLSRCFMRKTNLFGKFFAVKTGKTTADKRFFFLTCLFFFRYIRCTDYLQMIAA